MSEVSAHRPSYDRHTAYELAGDRKDYWLRAVSRLRLGVVACVKQRRAGCGILEKSDRHPGQFRRMERLLQLGEGPGAVPQPVSVVACREQEGDAASDQGVRDRVTQFLVERDVKDVRVDRLSACPTRDASPTKVQPRSSSRLLLASLTRAWAMSRPRS